MKKKLFIIVPLLAVLISFLLVYRYYNKEDVTTSLNASDRTWVQNNKDKIIDIEVLNNYPLYGENGNGVFFDFLNDFEKSVGLEFNRIPYLKESNPTKNEYVIRAVDGDKKLSSKDLLIFEDFYVAISKNYQRINNIRDMKNMTFGVFAKDKDRISYYLKSASNITLKTYDDIDSLTKALDNNECDMVIIPNIMYLDKTIDINLYDMFQKKLSSRIEKYKIEIIELEKKCESIEPLEVIIENAKKSIRRLLDINYNGVDDKIIEEFVERIIVHKDIN